MMFRFHSAISLELIALASGVALLIFIKNQTKIKNAWPIFAAWVVIILSALSIICSAFYALTGWNKGYFRMHHRMMKYHQMMENKDMNNEKQDNQYMMD